MEEIREKVEQPLFVNFLEGQEFPQVKSDIKAGRPPFVTLKWPSDDDEDPIGVDW